jgi:alkanesulfonate monooxygenase SsuD/methylene tetrahydromethanopterin reductase-like flavin-dependent oxidoreductase (luciferase family)
VTTAFPPPAIGLAPTVHPSIRLGLLLAPLDLPVRRPGLVALLEAAADAGFGTVWFRGPARASDAGRTADACTLAASFAGVAPAVRLGVVAGLPGPPGSPPARQPTVLARDVTALDVVTGGRASLGIGSADAGALTEAAAVCRGLFAGGPVTSDGPRFTARDAVNRPGPRTPGGPPILGFTDDTAGVGGLAAVVDAVATRQPPRSAAGDGSGPPVVWIADAGVDPDAAPAGPLAGVLLALDAGGPAPDPARLQGWAARGRAILDGGAG